MHTSTYSLLLTLVLESRKLLSSTRTERERLRRTRKCSRCTQAMLPDLSKCIKRLRPGPRRDNPGTAMFHLVHDWPCDKRNGRWLMIVDNADDNQVFALSRATDSSGSAAQLLEPAPAQEAAALLASCLSQAANGWILVTSRDLIAALNLLGAKDNVVRVEPMGGEEALALLKTKVRVNESSEGGARAPVETLEDIPLAVTHAAAYIAVGEPRVTFFTYLQLFHKSEENQTFLFNRQEARDIRRDTSANSAVITTW